MQKTILKKDEFVSEVIRIADRYGFKIENNKRNGLQQIDFGNKKLHAGHLEQLCPDTLILTTKILDLSGLAEAKGKHLSNQQFTPSICRLSTILPVPEISRNEFDFHLPV